MSTPTDTPRYWGDWNERKASRSIAAKNRARARKYEAERLRGQAHPVPLYPFTEHASEGPVCDRPGHDEDACPDCQKSLAEGRAENADPTPLRVAVVGLPRLAHLHCDEGGVFRFTPKDRNVGTASLDIRDKFPERSKP